MVKDKNPFTQRVVQQATNDRLQTGTNLQITIFIFFAFSPRCETILIYFKFETKVLNRCK